MSMSPSVTADRLRGEAQQLIENATTFLLMRSVTVQGDAASISEFFSLSDERVAAIYCGPAKRALVK